MLGFRALGVVSLLAGFQTEDMGGGADDCDDCDGPDDAGDRGGKTMQQR